MVQFSSPLVLIWRLNLEDWHCRAGSIGSLIAGCLSKTQCDLLLWPRPSCSSSHSRGPSNRRFGGGINPPNRWEVPSRSMLDLPESVHASCDVVVLTGKSSAFDDHLDVAKLFCETMELSSRLPMVLVMRSDWYMLSEPIAY